jgi:hypothetical protein
LKSNTAAKYKLASATGLNTYAVQSQTMVKLYQRG